MLGEILKALLITSIAGTCLTAVITLVKPITKKVFGYVWHYYIWLAVLAVMLLPVRFTLPQKADTVPVTVQQTVQNVQTAQTAENTGDVIPTMQTEPETDIRQTGTSFVKGIIDSRLSILAYLWLTGAIMLLLINLISYIRLIIKIRKNSVVVYCPQITDFTKRKITVRVWNNISSPFMTGIFQPTLVLPARELTEEQLNNILRHEMTHFKRHDILYKWFVTLVKCLHWFNPVVYFIAHEIGIECEISCDLSVVNCMSADEEIGYINTILSLLSSKNSKDIPLTTGMTGSKMVLKRRFMMIRNKKKTGRMIAAVSVVIAIIMFATIVFASGILSDFVIDNCANKITNNGENLNFDNQSFFDNYKAETNEYYGQRTKIADSRLYISPIIGFGIQLPSDTKINENTQIVGYFHLSCSIPSAGSITILLDDDRTYTELGEEELQKIYSNTRGIPKNVMNFQVIKDSDGNEIGRTFELTNNGDTLIFTQEYKNANGTLRVLGQPIYGGDVNKVKTYWESFLKLSDDKNFKIYENAENLSLIEIQKLQTEVDNSHYPWRLDPVQTILEYTHNNNFGGGEITSLAGSGVNVSASYAVDENIYLVELFKPVRQDETGIWVVKSFETLTDSTNEIQPFAN